MDKKPTSLSSKTSNPFLPPFVDDVYVTEISQTHRLILNKFSVAKNHVLVVTKGFERNSEPLNADDIFASAKVMFALNGFAFYNCGSEAGASVTHKHLQVIPIEEFRNQVMFDEFEKIVELSGDEIAEYPSFKFRHCLLKLPSFDHRDTFESFSEAIFIRYKKMLSWLGNEDHKKSYNLIFTENWMFIALRDRETALNFLNINATGYLGRSFDNIV
eukprot:TRINITY_DN16055_c0_g1_i3.p1 TRINITY_DN16055_c0_g1~~TRINITY_DN16055_c0_g1_i3.p1  ORF type:complete len:216 (+),score=27.53 TRINITY_DN16055_c0_g1_i3:331-978(+)